MEDDEYADVLGVITALERTCELEAKLRQAIQDTHPLTTTLDWDFHAADKEREALLAIGEQLEYLEDKLREYKNMDSPQVDNKAVVLSQLDSVRRELVEVTQNRMGHISFGKEVVKEVLQFANMGAEDQDPGAEGAGPPLPAGLQSPPPPRGGRPHRVPGGVSASADGPLLPRKATSELGEGRTYAALMSPGHRQAADGSPSARSYDPSRASSPYGAFGQQQQQAAGAGRGYRQREDGYGLRDSHESGMSLASPLGRGAALRGSGEGRYSGGAAAGGGGGPADEPHRLPPPRRQINLDLASIQGGGGGGGGSAGRGGTPDGGAAGGYAPRQAPAQQAQRGYYSFRPGSSGEDGPSRQAYSAPSYDPHGSGSAATSARQQGGGGGGGSSSRPTSARSGGSASLYGSQYEGQPPSRGGGYGSGGSSGRFGSGSGHYPAPGSGGGGGRILNRLDPPPQQAQRQRPSSPMSMRLRPGDIYGAVNGAGSLRPTSSAGAAPYGGMIRIRDRQEQAEREEHSAAQPSLSAGAAGQPEYGGMVRIRDMLDRAEKDLKQVAEEKEQRRSPVPPRIFGEDQGGGRFSADDASDGGFYSPDYSSGTAGRRGAASVGTAGAHDRPARGSEESGGGRSRLRITGPPREARDVSRGREGTPGAAESWGGRASSSEGGRGRGSLLGRMIKRLAGLAVTGAALALGVAAVGAGVQWGRQHLHVPSLKWAPRGNKPAAAKAAARDIPPWMLPPPPPAPGSPQRDRRRAAAGSAAADRPPFAYPPPPQPYQPPPPPRPQHLAGTGAGPGSAAPAPAWAQQAQRGSTAIGAALPPAWAQGLAQQSPVTHVQPLPEGDWFPSIPPPDVNLAKG